MVALLSTFLCCKFKELDHMLVRPRADLTHMCRMDFPIHIIWMSPFSILGESGVIFHFISFCIEIPVSKQYSPRWDARHVLQCLIWGYTVCLCPKNRTPGLYGLIPCSNFWKENSHCIQKAVLYEIKIWTIIFCHMVSVANPRIEMNKKYACFKEALTTYFLERISCPIML